MFYAAPVSSGLYFSIDLYTIICNYAAQHFLRGIGDLQGGLLLIISIPTVPRWDSQITTAISFIVFKGPDWYTCPLVISICCELVSFSQTRVTAFFQHCSP